MNAPLLRVVRPVRRPHRSGAHPPRGRGRLGRLHTGAGPALILLAFIIVPSAVLGVLSWRAIETQKSYSVERLRASYHQVAGLAAGHLERQLRAAESRWNAELDDLLARSQGRPSPEQVRSRSGRETLIAAFFLLEAPGRVLYPSIPLGDEPAHGEGPGPAARARQQQRFARLVARGEAQEYETGNLPAAIAAYREVLIQVESPQLRALAESYIGRAQLKNGDRTGALATFGGLLERYPEVRDHNRMFMRFLAQYQIAVALHGLRRHHKALDVLLELQRDLLERSDAITTAQYSYYTDLVQKFAPQILSTWGLRDRTRYEEAFRTLGERNKERIGERHFASVLETELSDVLSRRRRFDPRTRYLSSRGEDEPFLLACRDLPDDQHTFVSGLLAARIDLAQLRPALATTLRHLQADAEAGVTILAPGDRVIIGEEAAAGTLMAAQDLAPPFDFWRVAIYLHDVPGAMKRLDVRHTIWLWLTSLMLLSIFFGVYMFLLRARRQAYLTRAQTTFVSNVTHELRTPLASIHMFAELLEGEVQGSTGHRGKRSAPARQYLGIIRQECERLSRLIEGVLDFSRMERDMRRYRFERGDVGAVVAASVESFRPHADARGFTLQVAMAPDLPPVLLDRDAIAQVMLNLLGNAVQYSDQEKDIRVRVARAGAGVTIEVADRGVGIAAEDLERVFDEFYSGWRRMDDRIQGGLGLGLTLSREIVRAHGGEISVRSEVGRGSTFTLTLPAAIPEHSTVDFQPGTGKVPALGEMGGRA